MPFLFHRSLAVSSIAFALFALGAGSVRASSILSVDLGTAATGEFKLWNVNPDGNGPRTTSFTVSDVLSVPLGSITATIASGTDPVDLSKDMNALNTRASGNSPANSGSFTQSNLLADRVVSTVAGTGLFLELSGFTPLTTFTIQVWGYDTQTTPLSGAKPGTFTLLDRTGGGNVSLGSFTTTAGALPMDNNTFSVTANVTSDANGAIIIESLSNMDGTGIMNGFVVSTVPEPTTGLLGMTGLGLLALRRRVRRSRSARV